LAHKIDEIDTCEGKIDTLVSAIDDPGTGLKAQIKQTEESFGQFDQED
jgi:hypothetical protein